MNFFSTPKHRSDKLSIHICIVLITKELSTKILNFITNGAGVLVLQSVHIAVSHVVRQLKLELHRNCIYFVTPSFYFPPVHKAD